MAKGSISDLLKEFKVDSKKVTFETERFLGKAITKRGSKAISGSTVSDAVKKWARRIGRKHQDYSAVSFRRGSVSVARADGTISRDMARQHLRHASEKSQDFYVERSRDARRAVGLAHRRAVERAAKKAVGRHVRFSV